MTRISRRQAVGGIALTAAGSVAGIRAMSDPVAADVTVDTLTVPDASFEADAIAPAVDVTAAYSYDVGAQSVGDVRVALSVDGVEVASDTLRTDRSSLSGDTDLQGTVTDADGYTSADFAVDVGEDVQRTLDIGLTFTVRDPDGKTIVEATDSTTTVVSIAHPQESEWTAQVGGEGSVIDTSG